MNVQTRLYLWVAVGSSLGSVARLFSTWAGQAAFGHGYPWGTLIVNVLGSFIIGFYFVLTEPDGRLIVGPVRRQFVLAGLCGGFTTFSVFSFETLLLLREDRWLLAAGYVGLSVTLWLVALWLGQGFGQRYNRLRRSG